MLNVGAIVPIGRIWFSPHASPPLPRGFEDSKVGISAHWGPYAVPGWTPRKDTPYGVAYAEWYWQWMQSNKAVQEYHASTYGGVPYDAFIDGTPNRVTGEVEGFFAKDFDADAWISAPLAMALGAGHARAGVRTRGVRGFSPGRVESVDRR